MKVLIFDTVTSAVEAVADRLVGKVAGKPDCVLGLATGGTVEPVYEAMVARYEAGRVRFDQVHTFTLDEYVGLDPTHPMSYHSYMARHLFDRTDFRACNTHIPHGNAADPAAEADHYERLIKGRGGIDLQLLGVGENGHIGFNEPTSSLSSVTRLKTLAPETVRANSRYFEQLADVPRVSITMGIATILQADEIALLATGSNKAKAVKDLIEGPLSAMCPASALQLHQKTEVYIDAEAAAELSLRDYYQAVHPGGKVGHP